jgi:hypothetical protein
MYDHLCPDQALCLPIPGRNTGGRPGLSFNLRRDVRILWNEIASSLARRGQSSRDPGLNPLLRQIKRAHKRGNGALAQRLSAQADARGRFHQRPILRPVETEAIIDKMVAEEFERQTGKRISERSVRRIRDDDRLTALVGKPIFEPPDWLVRETQQIWLRRRAAHHLSPAIMAKINRGELLLREIDGRLHLEPTTDGVIPGAAPCPRVGTHCGWEREKSQPKGRLAGVYVRAPRKDDSKELYPRGSRPGAAGRISHRGPTGVLSFADEPNWGHLARKIAQLRRHWPGTQQSRVNWHDPNRWDECRNPPARRSAAWTGWDSVKLNYRERTPALAERIRKLRALAQSPSPAEAASALRKALELEALAPARFRQTIQELSTRARDKDVLPYTYRLSPGSPWPHMPDKLWSGRMRIGSEDKMIKRLDDSEIRARGNAVQSPPSFDCIYPEGVLAKPAVKSHNMV